MECNKPIYNDPSYGAHLRSEFGLFTYKGEVAGYSSLPECNEIGDGYLMEDTGELAIFLEDNWKTIPWTGKRNTTSLFYNLKGSVYNTSQLPSDPKEKDAYKLYEGDTVYLQVFSNGKWNKLYFAGKTGENAKPGPKGDKGDPGRSLPDGKDGRDGVALPGFAPKGPKGDDKLGPRGEVGPIGEPGKDNNVKGLVGEQGEKGFDAWKQIRGDQGPKGDKGDPAPKGIPGPRGPKGEKGDDAAVDIPVEPESAGPNDVYEIPIVVSIDKKPYRGHSYRYGTSLQTFDDTLVSFPVSGDYGVRLRDTTSITGGASKGSLLFGKDSLYVAKDRKGVGDLFWNGVTVSPVISVKRFQEELNLINQDLDYRAKTSNDNFLNKLEDLSKRLDKLEGGEASE